MHRKEQIDTLMKEISTGARNRDACILAGIDETYFHEKLKKNPEFARKVDLARMKWKRFREKSIARHGAKNWTAHAWSLEREYPEQFALKTMHEITGRGGGAIEHKFKAVINLAGIPREALLALARLPQKKDPAKDS